MVKRRSKPYKSKSDMVINSLRIKETYAMLNLVINDLFMISFRCFTLFLSIVVSFLLK